MGVPEFKYSNNFVRYLLTRLFSPLLLQAATFEDDRQAQKREQHSLYVYSIV